MKPFFLGGLFSGTSEYFQCYDVIKINCPITSGHIDKRKASLADLVHYPIENERIFFFKSKCLVRCSIMRVIRSTPILREIDIQSVVYTHRSDFTDNGLATVRNAANPLHHNV